MARMMATTMAIILVMKMAPIASGILRTLRSRTAQETRDSIVVIPQKRRRKQQTDNFSNVSLLGGYRLGILRNIQHGSMDGVTGHLECNLHRTTVGRWEQHLACAFVALNQEWHAEN